MKPFKRLIFLVIPFLFSCSFLNPAGSSPTLPSPIWTVTITPRATPYLTCKANTCVRNIYVTLDSKVMLLQFDLVDKDNQVLFGQEPTLDNFGTIDVYLARKTYASREEIYLFGGEFPTTDYDCYIGNDLTWSYGFLGSVCSLSFPINRMQVRPQIGELLRVEVKKFNRSEYIPILAYAPSSPGSLNNRSTQAITVTQTITVTETPAPTDTPVYVETETPLPTETLPPTEMTPPVTGAHAIGELVRLEGQTIVLNSVDFTDELLRANFAVENQGSQDLDLNSMRQFSANDEDGKTLEQTTTDCDLSLDGLLPPGRIISGDICWIGPFSTTLKLFYEPEVISEPAVVWEITQ